MNASDPTSDQNLLLGILALQMDFIDRDQLVAAMHAWVLDKTRPLAQILTAQGALGDDEKSLLLALVAKHMEIHGNSPQRSLAAISSVSPSVCDELRSIADDDVEASLVHVAAIHTAETDLAATASRGRSTSEGQRFRVLRPHAKGGLGEVFVASDTELPREVALKQIREERADSEESRARFMLEAEITGGLEHPGIVPVYGLGHYASGRPFYAMRFIRGDSLREAIKQFHQDCKAGMSGSDQSLRLRGLLGRFIDVCNAVEYAHSRGVLHRDLKPGNIMLGKYGETLVVDWGLAKAVGHRPDRGHSDEPTLAPLSGKGTAPTEMGSAIGTPAYMSPEQAAGRLDLLGPASDVYSLGATLYALLTGEHPFKGDDTATVLRRVQKGDFPRVRETAPKVPAPLEAICMKAMATAPEQRYGSPRALADDIEHWLADEPVSAHRDPLLARAARWARRHKVAVATVTVLLLTALVSLSIGTVLLTGANRRIRTARELAEKNEQIANENFQMARKAVDDYMTTVSQETLLNEPGMQPLRRKLLSEALGYYRRFVQQRADDPELQLELRDANFLVGTISSRIGKYPQSLAAFRRALDINQRLVDQDPANVTLQFKLARCYNVIGAALAGAGQSDDALKSHEQALQLLERITARHPRKVAALAELHSTYNSMGSLKHHQGDLQATLSLYKRGLEIGGHLAESEDPHGEYHDSHARTYHNMAILSHEMGDQEQAIKNYQKSIEIRAQLIDRFPRDQKYQSNLALSYGGLANTLAELGRLREAIEYDQRAAETRERLARENPAVTKHHDLLAGSYGNLATKFRQIGDLEQAADLGLKATAIWQRLAEQHPEMVDYRESLGTSLYNLGNLHLGNPAAEIATMDDETRKKKASKAVRYYLSSIEVYESLLTQFPDIPEYQASLATSYNNCGSAYHMLDEKEKAREMTHKALTVREKLVANNPDVPVYRNQLASTYSNAAGDESDPKKSVDMLNKAADLRQSLVDDFPNVPDYRYKLAFTLQFIALRQFLGGQQEQAMPTFRRLIPMLEQLHAEFPNVPVYRKMLVQSLHLFATGQRLSDELEKAAATEQKTVAIFQRLLSKDTGNVEFLVGLASGYEGVGKCFHKSHDYEKALACYAEALQTLEPLLERESGNRQLASNVRHILELRADILETLERHEEAVADLSRAIELSAKSPALLLRRARLRALSGQHAVGAGEVSEAIDGETKLSKGEFYDAACVFSLAVAAAREDNELDKEGRETVTAEYIEKAIDCLRRAREAGFFATSREIEHLSKDTDFETLRAEPAFIDFQKLLGSGAG